MKRTYTAPRQASWTFVICPYDGTDYLIEDAPFNENTRAIFQLVEPVRNWLAENRHKMTVDRGDFGDGDEHFHITFTSEYLADEFERFCNSLK